MKRERIEWLVLPIGEICQCCKKNEAIWWETIEINLQGTLTIGLCDDCSMLPDETILERILK